MVVESSKEYRTSETQLAAYLVQEGFNLLIIEYEQRPNGGRARGTFVFEDSPKLQNYVKEYNRGDATINLALYEHAKSALLDRVMKGLP